jgi:hypothetical protein
MITERQMKIAILVEILVNMDMPQLRMELSRGFISRALWNLRVRNNDQGDIDLAIATLKELAKA